MQNDMEALQIAKKVDAILHVPGNYQGGNLEMTIVLDTSLRRDMWEARLAAVVKALKRSSEIFRNVRMNLVQWKQDDIKSEVVPMAMLTTGSVLQDYESCRQSKAYEDLFAYLKKFHARSKVILIFADTENEIEDAQKAKEALTPFLKNKLLLCDGQISSGTQLFMQLCRM